MSPTLADARPVVRAGAQHRHGRSRGSPCLRLRLGRRVRGGRAVYVNDNTTGTNTIGAFDRHADGSLTPEAGSPFAAGGAGTGSGLASQGALQLSAGGRFLIAVDAGSNQVSVLRIRPGGSLRLVSHGVVSSGGLLPAAPGSPFPAEGAGPFGSQFRPADPGQLFVSNAHNTQPDSGTVSAFTAKLRRRG